MTRWSKLAVEVQIPAGVAQGHAVDLMREEAVAAGLLSEGLVVGDLVIEDQDGAVGAHTYRLSFLAEYPLDVDQVGSILVRRLQRRLEQDRVAWLCVAYERPWRPRPPAARRCRTGGA